MEGRWTLLLIVYFAGLAALIGGLASMGIKPNEQTVLVGMAVVAGGFGLLWIIVKLVKRLIRKTGYSMKQFGAAMMGAPAEVVEAMPGPQSRALVVQHYGTEVVPYYAEDDDEDEDWSTFIEPDGLPLADTFRPHISGFLGQVVSVFGLRRSGKSNCVSVLIEAFAPYLLPMLICDTKDEFAGLVNPKYMPHGYMAGAPGATANVPDEVRAYYISLDEAGAFEFGKAIMEGAMQVVLNLKSYSTDDEAARVMCEIVRGINAWQEARPNKKRVPSEIVLSEGHKWLPQNESNDIAKETQNLLHKTFFQTVVRLGGANGLGLIVDSQRPSELDKRCLQSLWKFFFKQTEKIDIKKYEEYNLDQEDILALQTGECFVFSPSVLGFPVKMYRKRSPDLSTTPTLEQLAMHRQTARAKTDMLARRRSYTQKPAAGDTRSDIHLVHSETEAPAPPVTPPPDKKADELSDEYKAILEQWWKGKRTHREIAAILKMSPNRVYNILVELDGRYIERNKKKVAR